MRKRLFEIYHFDQRVATWFAMHCLFVSVLEMPDRFTVDVNSALMMGFELISRSVRISQEISKRSSSS